MFVRLSPCACNCISLLFAKVVTVGTTPVHYIVARDFGFFKTTFPTSTTATSTAAADADAQKEGKSALTSSSATSVTAPSTVSCAYMFGVMHGVDNVQIELVTRFTVAVD